MIFTMCFIMFGSLLFNSGLSARLTNQQINLLLENDDVQIFNLSSGIVKKSTVSIKGRNEGNQGKTIVQYDQDGLLINYYSASLMDLTLEEQGTMITTLMRNKDNQWLRKQTVGNYQLNNSIYNLKDDLIQITLLPSYELENQRLVLQKNSIAEDTQDFFVTFSYQEPTNQEQLNIEYHFNQDGLLKEFQFISINEYEHGHTSSINNKFEYDELNRLIKGDSLLHYQSIMGSNNNISSQIIYSDFDRNGNWLTKTEELHGEKIVYKRIIEYWE